MPSRRTGIEAFYAAKATELERAIRCAITGPHALVEDACATAWLQLLRNPQVALDRHGFRWLYVVALREAYRLSDRMRREVALGAPSDLLPLPAEDTATIADRLLDHQARVELLAQLPARKREMVVLHAAGFRYQEIASICGVTSRTAERQLLRGKRTLRRLTQEAQAAAESAE